MVNISVSGGTLVFPKEVPQAQQNNPNKVEDHISTRGFFVTMVEKGLENLEQERTLTKTPVSEDPDRQFYQSTVPMDQKTFEPEPVGVPDPTITTMEPADKKVDIPQAPEVTTEEIKEPTLQAEEPPAIVDEEVVSEPDIFSTLTIGDTSETVSNQEHMTTMFGGLKDVEGESSHVDGRGYFTMAYGVVPDANSVTKADGTKFDPRGTHGFTTKTAGTVDVSKATHTLSYKNKEKKKVSFTVKREDYDSEKSFAKAVVSLYNRESKKMYGDGWDSLPNSAKSMALDLAWNGGVGAVGWNDTQTSMKEAAKDNPSTENLFLFTRNMRSGTTYPRGLFKRRLIQYNLIANEADKAATYSTEAVNDAQGKRIGTKYIANRSDGTVIGSWSYTDKPEDPNTKEIELRTPSTEIIEANVAVQ